jgi:hypothetical protein
MTITHGVTQTIIEVDAQGVLFDLSFAIDDTSFWLQHTVALYVDGQVLQNHSLLHMYYTRSMAVAPQPLQLVGMDMSGFGYYLNLTREVPFRNSVRVDVKNAHSSASMDVVQTSLSYYLVE